MQCIGSTVHNWYGHSPLGIQCNIVYPTIRQYHPNLARLLLTWWYHPNPVWIRTHNRQCRPKLVRSLAQISGVDE